LQFKRSFFKGKAPRQALKKGAKRAQPPGSFVLPLAEPDFLSDVQVDLRITPAATSHTTQARLASRE